MFYIVCSLYYKTNKQNKQNGEEKLSMRWSLELIGNYSSLKKLGSDRDIPRCDQ